MVAEAAPPLRPRLSRRVVATRYIAFAILSSLTNIGTQWAAGKALPAITPIFVSILLGTGVGFAVKYVLDKKFVFLDTYTDHLNELRKVVLYGLFSVGTTALFWAVELSAFALWRTEAAKFAGAAVGLALGNFIKYRLDRTWVFPSDDRP